MKNVAVVLAAHGDLGSQSQSPERQKNQALLNHVSDLQNSGMFSSVSAGVIKGAPALEVAFAEVLKSDPQQIIVYPFFMADGYFVKTVLTKRLAQMNCPKPVQVCPPLGLDPGLPPLLLANAHNAAQTAGLEITDTRLLIVGHGSKFGPASAEATRRAATAVRGLEACTFACVEVAFLEEKPFLADQIDAGGRKTLVSGFFNGDGLHAGEDVPAAIEAADADAVYAGPIGRLPEIAPLIEAAILTECRAPAT